MGSHNPAMDELEIAGLSAVVSLLHPEEPGSYDDPGIPGVTWYSIPVRDFTAPSVSDLFRFVEIVERAEGTVLVHCLGGCGRTGTFGAAWLMRKGDLSAENAIGMLREVNPHAVETDGQKEVLELFEKVNWPRLYRQPEGGIMGTRIYWFSGSGNSLHVAKRLKEGIEGAELVPVSQAVGKVTELPERMGLVFPVYAWGPPVLVSRFIESLPSGSPEYVFAVATCGGSPGSAMSITRRRLGKRGIRMDAAMTVRMVENYPPMGGAPGKEKQTPVLEKAEEEINAIVERIREGYRGSTGKNSLFFSIMGRLVYPLFSRNVSRQAVKFLSDGKCNSCGICSKVCPAGNIHPGEDGRPLWGDHCEQCFACFHWCPEEAVQFGKKTERQTRYHHPGAALSDMLTQGRDDRQ